MIQELLNYMLNVLHEDSKKVKKKPYVKVLEDNWVKNNNLEQVGKEAWRWYVDLLYNDRMRRCLTHTVLRPMYRFLHCNRSVMVNVAMGQVLNTVTCPMCKFSSWNFDPFNLLLIPFPTVADVVFLCTVIWRGTAMNSPHVLNQPKKGKKKSRFNCKRLKGMYNIGAIGC